ncbi:MAG: DEAD/DEAH box helicase [Gemmatimonadota bacterium]
MRPLLVQLVLQPRFVNSGRIVIPQDLARQFPSQLCTRGSSYFQAGRVRLSTITPEVIEATVKGTRTYAVTIEPQGRRPERMRCTCPYADDNDTCKHMWAALLAADAAHVFDGMSPMSNGTSDHRKGARVIPFRKQTAAKIDAPPPAPRSEWKLRLRQLRKIAVPSADEPAAPVSADLFLHYRFDADTLYATGEVAIDVVMPGRRSGTYTGFSDEQWLGTSNEQDRDIAHRLLGARPRNIYYEPERRRRFVIPPLMYENTLRAICETGRCHFESPTGALAAAGPLAWDTSDPWQVRFAPEEMPQSGWWCLRGWLQRAGGQWPVDDVLFASANGLIGFPAGALGAGAPATLARADLRASWPLVLALRTNGPIEIPPSDLFEFATELLLMPGAPAIELPHTLGVEQTRPQPQPRLRLEAPPRHSYDSAPRARLAFSYDGLLVKHRQKGRAVVDKERRRIVHRDLEREGQAFARLLELGAQLRHDWRGSAEHLVIAVKRVEKIVHTLVTEGWYVEADDIRYRVATHTSAAVRSGIDWFELDGTVEFDDQRAGLVELLAALRRGEKTVRLGDGSYGLLPAEWLQRYASIAGLGTAAESDATLRFTRAQAGLLDALVATLPDIRIDETFARIRDELGSFERVRPQAAPVGFHGKLRHYQQEAIGWFSFLRRFGLGGCLADDMGLGKTVQVLALLEQRRQEGKGPSLVVVPKSLVFNWLREADRFTPELRVRDYSGTQRRQAPLRSADFDLLVTTYGTLRRDAPELREIEFDYAIIDEAQAIKNAATASAKATRLLNARHRLALSGTPIENHLGELWSLFEFLNPGMLGAAPAFAQFRGGSATAPNPESRALLARALKPFLLRRTKDQVAPELPPRIEQTLVVELEREQRALYDSLRDHYRAALLGRIDQVGIKRAKIQILEALLRLRQAACHPGLIDQKRGAAGSAKLDVLLEQVEEVIAEGHKALVFSQFTSFLALVRQRLDARGVRYEYLDGRTRDRQARVDRFQSDDACPLFLISLRAGGQGLNLTAADYVFVLDPWWNPAVEAQAIDRTHRIGQDKRVIALRLIARDTVEEKVLALQQTKRELADAILGEESSLITRITRDDLERLFG